MDNRLEGTIIFGKIESARILLFETAIHFAEEGNSVLFISPKQWQGRPAIFHDRERTNSDSLKRIKIMYLSDHESLVNKLIDLHTFTTVPTVLIIDYLDHYLKVVDPEESTEFHIARLCAAIAYSMNNCAQTLTLDKVRFCSSVSSVERQHVFEIYFSNFWTIYNDDENQICLTKCHNKCQKIYKFKQLEDKAFVMKEIVNNKSIT